ncbi:hypothetical protein BpHYR1_027555 [Brachionus plicatilis]|uniref:Uncharacterized protein n=1 Tax=Brachionus plicatilis TaxID=10195 RepID=A0A3M7SNB5_BRAPC|nr:hypothetical protein BpHYR1_027555 [Brachionus plicatilis]
MSKFEKNSNKRTLVLFISLGSICVNPKIGFKKPEFLPVLHLNQVSLKYHPSLILCSFLFQSTYHAKHITLKLFKLIPTL